MTTRPRLFAFITTKSSERYTGVALATFFENTALSPLDRVIVIDNDNSYQLPSDLSTRVTLRSNHTPQGFATNMNGAIIEAISQRMDVVLCNNDLAFTRGWLDHITPDDNAILSPLSNRELQYRTGALNTSVSMQLEEYSDHAADLEAICTAHRERFKGTMQVTTLPFFCCIIPLPILDAVGLLDETFGVGGAEDYDYCFRAYLSGFFCRYALASYILHFGGKSSWSGVENKEAQYARERIFKSRFLEKWGDELFALALEESAAAAIAAQHADSIKAGKHAEIIRTMLGDRKILLTLR